MIRYLLKITFRNFVRHKAYSIINILGLAIGMAAFIMIMLWVEIELSFEEGHSKADNIVLTYKGYSIGGKTDFNASLPIPLGIYVNEHFPEASNTVRVLGSGVTISYKDKVFHESGFAYVDSGFFDVFTYEFIQGRAEHVLNEAHAVVISRSVAEKYFGNEDPLGKILTRDQSQQFVVSGIIEDPPDNTHLRANIITNLAAWPDADNYIDNWGDQFISTYILMDDPDKMKVLEKRMTEIMQENLENEQTTIRLQPIKKLHLYSMGGRNEGLQYIISFSLIAAFIILIACINFMNLTTARYSNRAREIGLKKVIGVTRWQLIRQFLAESIIMTLIAAILAMMLAELVRPYFNEITGKSLYFNYLDINLILRLVGLILTVGLLSGSYPALILSGFQPAEILRKKLDRGERGTMFRKILVIFQFVISTILIFSVLIIYRQISFISGKDPGYQTEDILYLPTEGKIETSYESFRNELLASPYIEDAGRCSQLPCNISWIMRGIELEGREDEGGVAFGVASVDHSYFSTIRLPITEGRPFSRNLEKDSSAVIFNEEALKLIGEKYNVGSNLSFYENDPDVKIIGSVPNFHSMPLSNEIEPLVFVVWEDSFNYLVVRTSPGMTSEAKEHIEKLWQDYAPGFPFFCSHLENYINRLYRNAEKVGSLAGILTILALFISALGLIGLTAFIVEQKYKEIGLRKIFGSSLFQIQYMISSKYIRLVLIATMIAMPLAWFSISSWLNNFAYRVNIRLIDFLITAVITILVAIVITYLQILRASLMKPVDVLKYE